MIIKDSKKIKESHFTIFLKVYFAASILLILLFSIFFFNTGVWKKNKQDILHRIHLNGINHYTKIIEIGFFSVKSFFTNIEELNLNINYENYLELEIDRKKIVEQSKTAMRERNHVFKEISIEMATKNEKAKGQARLKGDRITHFEKDKSSFKITLSDEDKIFGIKKFSLMKPRARNYIHEWLFHELASEGGLIKLFYRFINLRMNGNSMGLYVFEENFDKVLIERNKRRNGPIFSLTEGFSKLASSSKFEVYNKNYWSRPENRDLPHAAENKIKKFYEGVLRAEEVFDLKKWFWLFAVADLTYTHHGLSPVNVKFYFNPLSGLFEPIPYDGHRFNPNYNKNLKNYNEETTFDKAQKCIKLDCKKLGKELNSEMEMERFLQRFFYDEKGKIIAKNYKLYRAALSKITSKEFLNSFFNEEKREKIKKINSKIYGDYFLIDIPIYAKYGPGFYYFSYEDLFYRASFLQKKIDSNLAKINIEDNAQEIKIKNYKNENNLSLKPIELICETKRNNNTVNLILNLNDVRNIPKLNFDGEISINKTLFDAEISRCQFLKFEDIIKKTTLIKEINYLNNFTGKIDAIKNYENYFYQKEKLLVLKNNLTIIDQDVYIPNNFEVHIYPGQKIILKDASVIFSASPWIVGNKNQKKVFIGGLKSNFGGGIIIKSDRKEKSIFINTEFSYLSGPKGRTIQDGKKIKLISSSYVQKNRYLNKTVDFNFQNYLSLPEYEYLGAINFYNSLVQIDNCSFSFINSEDALNIISSKFEINNTFFRENLSDGIDIDFSDGIMKNVKLRNIGNDGIDISGSKVTLHEIRLLEIGDKSISIGESADVEIININSKNSFLGLVSKDGSKTIASKIEFENVAIPFAAYRKKTSYDFGDLVVSKPIKLKKYKTKTLKDKNSKIVINGKEIKNFTKNHINIVYKKNLNLIDG